MWTGWTPGRRRRLAATSQTFQLGGTYVDEDGVRRSSVTLGPATGMSLHT